MTKNTRMPAYVINKNFFSNHSSKGHKMVDNTKQVRVDNWGIFFLQRLQMFFSKTDYCDLTLQFEGNVQLKVHRLVMNACTEYFSFLEQAYPSLEEGGTILMPPDLQSDVIVPIVNFMYTGMLEFHVSTFDKLYKAAEIMNISVLMKLLDAQKTLPKVPKKRDRELLGPKKTSTPKASAPDLPPALPGRKLPVWKRTIVPQHPITQLFCPDKNNIDPLMVHDNAPKPSRFEWPDEDLVHLNPLESNFENISYTSKPLLTQEDEQRVAATASTSLEQDEKKSFGEGDKDGEGQVNLFGNEEFVDVGQKRKAANSSKPSPKRTKNNDKENKETTISVKSKTLELDHTKIVTEILKKYPNLVKKNKNIKLKIMPMSPTKTTGTDVKGQKSSEVAPKRLIQEVTQSPSTKEEKLPTKKTKVKRESNQGPWVCHKCGIDGEPQEFVLYYLYRKHMTDAHHEVFDIKLCKYCGLKCTNHHTMTYHLFTKHGMRPHSSFVFPQCEKCPYIAFSEETMTAHKAKHDPDEVQCHYCKLAFINANALNTHYQLTGHLSKQGKPTNDCLYCNKKLQFTIDLQAHIKTTHVKEMKRDGLICLEEMDNVNEDLEEEVSEPEEILGVGEVPMPKDKVKIISDVKVPNSKNQISAIQQEIIPITTTAETLNDVTGSIATNLGLVDIVVLDENQQYILQDNQNEQTEFILPELSNTENPFSGQVITTQHSTILPQGVLQGTDTDIGSADELVMVLTDHDYQDEQEGENTNNSNIVVLYSHPVDGQGQFITSQGNLLVNSQTGMLEIRDGASIDTTSANQIVVNNGTVEEPIESIEMIQKEIESQNMMKQEPQESYLDEDRKPIIQHAELPNQSTENKGDNVEASLPEGGDQRELEDDERSDRFVEEDERSDRFVEEDSFEEQTEAVPVSSEGNEEVQNPNQEAKEQEEGKEEEEESQQVVEENVNKDTGDCIDGQQEEPMEVEEVSERNASATKRTEPHEEEETLILNNPDNIHHSEDESQDIPPEAKDVSHEVNDPQAIETMDEEAVKETENAAPSRDTVEPMEVDGKVTEETIEDSHSKETESEKVETENSQTQEETATEQPDEPEAQNNEEDSVFQDSSKSQETVTVNSSNIDKTILEDWEEDTDSQHSERQKNHKQKEDSDDSGAKRRSAADNVNKLMDDWEEEEEDK